MIKEHKGKWRNDTGMRKGAREGARKRMAQRQWKGVVTDVAKDLGGGGRKGVVKELQRSAQRSV